MAKKLTIMEIGHKVCSGCGIDKPVSEYSRKGSGIHSKCKACKVKEVAEWKKKNKDKADAQRKRHQDRESARNAIIREERRRTQALKKKYTAPAMFDACWGCYKRIRREGYCDDCRKKLSHLIKVEAKWISIQNCPICGNPFSGDKKFCSQKCRTVSQSRKQKERYHSDPEYRNRVLDSVKRSTKNSPRKRDGDRRTEIGRLKKSFISSIRKRLRDALNGKYSRELIARDIGCTIEYLKDYLTAQFTDGMSWDNYGFGNDKWHIDHIKPLNTFNLQDPDELARAIHYTNLRPLWQKDNLRRPKDGSDIPKELS